MKKRILINLIFPLISLLVMLSIWFGVAKATDSVLLLPTPLQTLQKMGGVFKDSYFYLSLWFTIKRTFFAFALSFFAAFVWVMITAIIPYSESFLKPLLYIVRCLPTMSVVLLFIIWTDSNITPILVTMLVLFPMTYSSLAVAIKDTDKDLVETAVVFGANKLNLLKSVYLPQILPAMVDSVASGLSLGLKVVVSAEVLAQSFNSMGWLMQESRLIFDTARLMALTSVVVILCMAVEVAIRTLGKKLYAWR